VSKNIDSAAPIESTEPSPKAPAQGPNAAIISVIEQWVIFVLLYIFSIGPMYWPWHQAKNGDGYRIIAVLYEPLYFLAGVVPWFGDWLNWYVGLWI